MKTLFELQNAAVEHHKKKEYAEAESIYELLITLAPDDPQPAYLLGSMYLELNRYGLAIALLLRAMDASQGRDQKRSEIANNLGIALRYAGHDDAALATYKLAIEWDEKNVDAWSNLSGYWVNQGNPDECINASDKCLELDPKNGPAGSHKGIAMLEKGDWVEGWKQYQTRYNVASFTKRGYDCPHWDGSKVGTLAIHGEQGLGDEILFMSFLSEAKKRADKVVIECAPRLVQLFRRSFGVPCYGTHEELVAEHKADAYCPMGSLPVYVGPLPPHHMGYLKADPGRVAFYRQRLSTVGRGPYIGLSWKGGTIKTHQHLRNAGIAEWQSLFDVPGTFVSLQYGEAGRGAEGLKVPHWQEAIDDLDELAALIAACDYVVSVCNTTIHIAGALNKPCFVLTPKKPAWRYGLTGDSVPWYPSVRLFRQDKEWRPVFEAVKAALNDSQRQHEAA